MIRLPQSASDSMAGATAQDEPASPDKRRSANESGFGDGIASTYDSEWSASAPQRSDLMAYAVRMVTPMRREFGRSMDVTHFLYDPAYAREVIAQAKTSRDARLRGYATFLEMRLFGQQSAQSEVMTQVRPRSEPSIPEPAAGRLAQTMPSRERFKDAKAFAAHGLALLLGPSSERLCRRILSATDMAAFVDVFDRAYSVVRDIHGPDEARRYGAAIEARLGGDVTSARK